MSRVDQASVMDVDSLIQRGKMCAELEQNGWKVVFSHERDYAYQTFALADKPAIARALWDACLIKVRTMSPRVYLPEWNSWLSNIYQFGSENYTGLRLSSTRVWTPNACKAYLYFDGTQRSWINVAFIC